MQQAITVSLKKVVLFSTKMPLSQKLLQMNVFLHKYHCRVKTNFVQKSELWKKKDQIMTRQENILHICDRHIHVCARL